MKSICNIYTLYARVFEIVDIFILDEYSSIILEFVDRP